jgi:hypothetical protein
VIETSAEFLLYRQTSMLNFEMSSDDSDYRGDWDSGQPLCTKIK